MLYLLIFFAVTLSRSNYGGILLQVRVGSAPVGTFSLPQSGFRFVSCDANNAASTIAHANGNPKTVTEFFWTAPASCENADYVIR